MVYEQGTTKVYKVKQVAARELGWAGYGEVLLFVALLGAALIYLWKIGALDWAREPRRSRSI